jgi:hypothetical protein
MNHSLLNIIAIKEKTKPLLSSNCAEITFHSLHVRSILVYYDLETCIKQFTCIYFLFTVYVITAHNKVLIYIFKSST